MRYFPNYSALAVLSCMAVTALVLDHLYIPAGETLFRPRMFFEFMTVVVLSAAIFSIALADKKGRVMMTKEEVRLKVWHCAVSIAIVYGVLTLFSAIKSVIPVLHPYGIDAQLIGVENFIHLGSSPTLIVSKFLEKTPGAFPVIDFIYMSWFFFIYIYLTAVLFIGSPNSARRERYIFCFCALWFIGGNFFAVLFSSVGPVFLQQFYPATSDAGIVALENAARGFNSSSQTIAPYAYNFKKLLNDFMVNPSVVDLNAPSAMPSLHVAMAFLTVMHAKGVNKYLFVATLAFACMTLLGSVALFWHYAIDGYFSILLVWVLWRYSRYLPAPDSKLQCIKRASGN